MKKGILVEIGPTKEVLGNPKAEYTKSLVSSVRQRIKKLIDLM